MNWNSKLKEQMTVTNHEGAKYDRDNLEVKLRDALFLVHPKAKDEQQQALFDPSRH